MKSVYYAESKLITGKDVFDTIYYFMEENFWDSPLEFYGYYLLNSFYKDSKGYPTINISEEKGSAYFSALTMYESKYKLSLKAFNNTNEIQSIVLSYFYKRSIDTPNILVSKNKEKINIQATGSLEPTLERKIRETYNYTMNSFRKNHLYKKY